MRLMNEAVERGDRMENAIIQQISEIEEKENVKIIYCAESGSRAWGFSSSDSDFDVRFIYVRPKEEYLRLDNCRDVIEWQLDETLDINGWDIRKALILLYKSNPTLFEWNNSPIIYKTTEEWDKISAVINKYFVAKSGLYHYMNMAEKNYREYLSGETVKLKKYFYVLRPILACKWILDEGTPPPMLFSVLMKKYLEKELVPEITELLETKINSPEITEVKKIIAINSYIEKSFEQLRDEIKAIPPHKKNDWAELNKIFLSLLE